MKNKAFFFQAFRELTFYAFAAKRQNALNVLNVLGETIPREVACSAVSQNRLRTQQGAICGGKGELSAYPKGSYF